LIVKRSAEGMVSDNVMDSNLLLANVFLLPDDDFAANWGFLSQLVLSHALHRAAQEYEYYGHFKSDYILERLLQRRKRLPPDVDATIITIVVCQELFKSYFIKGKYINGLRVLEQQLEEIGRLEVGSVPEQASFVCIQMASCHNMLRHKEEALKWLAKSFSYLTFQNLPPHRFKAHLLVLLEHCLMHDRLENPHSDSLSFVPAAHSFYKLLAQEIEQLEVDNPWDRIMEQMEDQLKSRIAEAHKKQREAEVQATSEQQKRLDSAIKFNAFLRDVGNNPNLTYKQKLVALRKMFETEELSAEETKEMNKVMRTLFALDALGDDYVPKYDPSKLRNRY
jgi:hypothetical protein